MVFTDIEQSTRLLGRLGSAYADALDEHRRELRAAWSAHDGVEMGTEGDSFFVVFPTAEHAVAAATAGQRALGRHPWPAGQEVRVRMGIHTGEPEVRGGGYVGMDVHRAARIAGAAHGGQVVISEATAKLVDAHLPAGVQLRDLGGHRLKDLPAVEHLYQLVIADLPADFPPLASLGVVSGLPVTTTSLVGRDRELAELVALLADPELRKCRRVLPIPSVRRSAAAVGWCRHSAAAPCRRGGMAITLGLTMEPGVRCLSPMKSWLSGVGRRA